MKNRMSKEGLSRRRFLGDSVAATVAAFGSAGKQLSHAVEKAEQRSAADDSFIAFRSGQPIWPEGREKEMNLWVGFRAVFEAPQGKHSYLRMAGCTFYRVYVNGKFHAWGPGRGPKDYFRVDLWDITPLIVKGQSAVCVEVAGYDVNSYYVLDQASFLQAEITTMRMYSPQLRAMDSALRRRF